MARNNRVFPAPRSPSMRTRSPGFRSKCVSLSMMQPVGAAISRSSKWIKWSSVSSSSMRLAVMAEFIHGQHGPAKARHAQQSGAPVRDAGKIVDEPAKRLLHLIEGADHHHQLAECHVAREIAGRGHQDRRNDREPAIAGGNPGQPCHGTDDPAGNFENGFEYSVDISFLIGFAAVNA